MPIRLRPMSVLLLGLALTSCTETLTPTEEQQLQMLTDESIELLRQNLYWKYFHEQLARFAYLEQEALTAEMTPEAALDAVEARVDSRCDFFARTSPTTARISARLGPIPDGCKAILGVVTYELTTGRSAEGALTLQVRTADNAVSGDSWAQHTVSPPGQSQGIGAETTWGRFDGFARTGFGTSLLFRTVLDGRGTITMKPGSVTSFRAEALEQQRYQCTPISGRLIVEFPEGLARAGVTHPVDVGLTFTQPDQFEVDIEGHVGTGTLTEEQCACPKGCADPGA